MHTLERKCNERHSHKLFVEVLNTDLVRELLALPSNAIADYNLPSLKGTYLIFSNLLKHTSVFTRGHILRSAKVLVRGLVKFVPAS